MRRAGMPEEVGRQFAGRAGRGGAPDAYSCARVIARVAPRYYVCIISRGRGECGRGLFFFVVPVRAFAPCAFRVRGVENVFEERARGLFIRESRAAAAAAASISAIGRVI